MRYIRFCARRVTRQCFRRPVATTMVLALSRCSPSPIELGNSASNSIPTSSSSRLPAKSKGCSARKHMPVRAPSLSARSLLTPYRGIACTGRQRDADDTSGHARVPRSIRASSARVTAIVGRLLSLRRTTCLTRPHPASAPPKSRSWSQGWQRYTALS